MVWRTEKKNKQNINKNQNTAEVGSQPRSSQSYGGSDNEGGR